MKKLTLTIAIVLGFCMTSFADGNQGGGLFQRGADAKGNRETLMPGLPEHNQIGNQDAPLGTGIAVLLGLGGTYFVVKRRKEE